MKDILVTGGFGFIGSRLVETLLGNDPDCNVHVVDDLSTSPIDIDDYITRLDSDRFSFHVMTVDDYFRNYIYLRKPFDEVYHLASPVGPASVIKQGGHMVGMVVNDIYLIMKYCIGVGAKLLDVSTSEVYGGGDDNGLCSELTPKIFKHNVNMRMEYAIAKLAAETAIVNTCKMTDLYAVIIRPFNVAGQRQSLDGGFVVPRFIQQALNRLPFTVFNEGEDIRAFTHVNDIVDGLILAMTKGKSGSIYNLGNPDNKVKIKELPAIINRILGTDSPIEFVDPKKLYGDYYESADDKYPVSDKANDELNWHPWRSIAQIIADYHYEYQRQLEAGVLTQKIIK